MSVVVHQIFFLIVYLLWVGLYARMILLLKFVLPDIVYMLTFVGFCKFFNAEFYISNFVLL